MGRSYREELSELSATQTGINQEVPRFLAHHAAKAADSGLIVVASGGAKVVADWACRLHRTAFGSAAIAMTPLEYASLAVPVRATTWLISAGGRHPDIHQAASAARVRGDDCIVGIIGQSGSPLEAVLRSELRSDVVTLGLRANVDGFLATNSVWAMACALAKAYSTWLSAAPPFDDSCCDVLLNWGAREVHNVAHEDTGKRDLIVLHDSWGTLGAQDLETRFIETALTNLWVTDFRNFGHGRHFWVADRADRTCLIALWTSPADELAKSTLAVLPSELPVRRVRIPFEGIAGALASLAWSIHETDHWSRGRGRDPGRPGVPRFGELLYEGGFAYPAAVKVDPIQRAVFRKSIAASSEVPPAEPWQTAYQAARARLRGAAISAIVMDYDGTMVDSAKRYGPLDKAIATELVRLLEAGVCIGVATGRGDSVQRELRDVIPGELWQRVVIGYHNGAAVLGLDEAAPDLDGSPTDPVLVRACELLREEVEARNNGRLRCRENQLTITPVEGQSLPDAWRATRECLDRSGLDSIQVWLSSHSVDVLAPRCSKLHVVTETAARAACSVEDVLRIGDRGAWPGNDWQLLDAPLGLSVDQCSSNGDTCWNVLPPELRGAAGTALLLQRLQSDGTGKVRFFDRAEIP